MSLRSSIENVERFQDLVQFVGRDLEYETISDQMDGSEFWNGVGNSKVFLSDGREVVRVTEIPEDGKDFTEVKRHFRETGREGRELLNIVAYTNHESEITGEIHFLYHARHAGEEAGVSYDLKYFSVNPRSVSPVYYEYLSGIIVDGRSIEELDNEDSDESLLETFSVEKITNSFYEDFHDLIDEKLEPSISNLPDEVTPEHYSQLLTNRVLFILFIQEKKWLSTESGSYDGQKDYLQQKYVEVRDSEDLDVWEDFFKELFFKGLNQKADSPDIVGTVPYLNGGLFEKRDYEDEVEVAPEFFDALLSPEEVDNFGEKEGFLRNYKISLSENNPSEQEMVVDPEFIGRVFEMSMQDTDERSENGAFYTPKDITQYMAKNSIKQLLLNELPDKEEQVSNLVLHNRIDDNFTEKELQVIHDQLREINVLDPAVGSGAFIIAVMDELVGIFEAISPEIGEEQDTYDLKEHIIANNLYGVDIDAKGIELCKFRTWLHLMQDLDINLKTLKEQNDEYALPNLDFKFFVGNSLSGDYKPIEVIDEIKNQGYQTTLAADAGGESVIDQIAEKRQEFTETHNQERKKQLEKDIKDLTDQLEESISWAETDYYMSDVVNEASSEFDQKHNYDFKWSTKMPEVMAEGGFDIVIGNPPYRGSTDGGYIVELSDFLQEESKYYDKSNVRKMKQDLYQLFIFRGYGLTANDGILSYITSNTFFTIATKLSTRNLLLDNELKSVINASDDTFGATVSPAIFTVKNNQPASYNLNFISAENDDITEYTKFVNNEALQESEDLKLKEVRNSKIYRLKSKYYKNSFRKSIFEPNNTNIRLFEEFISQINEIAEEWNDELYDVDRQRENLDKIRSNHIDDINSGDVTILGLISWGGQGLITRPNEDFLAYIKGSDPADSVKQRNNNFKVGEKNENKYKSVNTVIDEDYVINISEMSEEEKKEGINSEKYENKFYVPFEKGFKDDDAWFKPTNTYIKWDKESLNNVWRLRDTEYYFRDSLFVSRGGSGSIKARYANKAVLDNSGTVLVPITEKTPAKYLLGIINSEITELVVENFINGTVNTQVSDVRYMPIPIPTEDQREEMVSLVDTAIKIKKQESNEDLENVEKEINELVGSIYGVELDE